MTKKFINILLAVVLLSTACVKKPQETAVIPEADLAEHQQEVTPPPVEDLIARSAAEMNNPLANRININEQGPSGSWEKANPVSGQDLEQSTQELPVICQGNEAANFDCYQKHYQMLVKEKGVKAAFVDLRKRYDKDYYAVSQCHPLTHVIGNSAVEKYPTVSQAYTEGDSFCWSGYYHGVLEGVIAKVGSNEIVAQINNLCSEVPGKANYSFDYYNCVHGLGHGLMAMTGTELFKSLELCDNLTGSWEQSSCYGGVYMENVIVDNKNHFTEYLKPKEPLYPCTAVGEKYKSSCYLMQTSYMLKVTGGDFAQVFVLCGMADANYITTCYQSLGRDASGRSSSNVETTKNTCNIGPNFEAKSNCIIGAVKDFISYFHSDTQAKTLCDSLSTDLQQICHDTAVGYYKNF